MNGYKENKSQLEAKCESYVIEARRLTQECADLEKLVAELQQTDDEHKQIKVSECEGH